MKVRLLVKRGFDLIGAAVMLTVLSPLLVVTAFMIRVKLGSPVIFRQKRPGKDNEIFTLYKFRTMKDATDKFGNQLPDEHRMTEFGSLLRRLSIDELPELINILKGEMSFVGPRPLLVEYLDVYTDEELHRHDVLPGLTGWAQVNGRNAISWKRKFELDLYYVNNVSLFLDLKIIWMTFISVIRRSDISQEGHVTTEKYNGSN